MTTGSRPAPGRKQTLRTEKNTDAVLDAGLKITVDGETYEVRLGEVSSTLARELRRGTGIKLSELFFEIINSPDVDSIAGFVWLARRIRGERVDVDDVIVTYAQILADDFEVKLPDGGDDDAEGDVPEA